MDAVSRWAPLVRQQLTLLQSALAVADGLAMVDIESGGNQHAQSPMNPGYGRAQGLMQVLPMHFWPDWQDRLDWRGELSDADQAYARDPERNLATGLRYFDQLYRRWGTIEQAAAGYFGALDQHGNITGATDVTGTSGNRYVDLFLRARARYVDVGETIATLSTGQRLDALESSQRFQDQVITDFRASIDALWQEIALLKQDHPNG